MKELRKRGRRGRSRTDAEEELFNGLEWGSFFFAIG